MTNEPLTAPKKNGGGSTNINIEQLINIGGYRQLSVPKPPILLAAKRYGQVYEKTTKRNPTDKRTAKGKL